MAEQEERLSVHEHERTSSIKAKARYCGDVIPFLRTTYRRRRMCKDRTGTSGRHALIDRSEYRRDPRDGLRRQISEGHSYFLLAMKYDCSICSVRFIHVHDEDCVAGSLHARPCVFLSYKNSFWNFLEKRLEYFSVIPIRLILLFFICLGSLIGFPPQTWLDKKNKA